MTSPRVRWEELLPREFRERQEQAPVVYLPLGLCEPHGHVAAFGLDTFKAVWLCEQAATRYGGIVAPTQGYQIHETGYHRPWLKEVIGETNPNLGSVPPDVLLRMLLFQLRAFVNAGFKSAVVLTGHHGNQADLRIVAEELMQFRPIRVTAVSDPELARGAFEGDHAGRYEISQLLHIRPDLVDLARLDDIAESPLGRFAQGDDAGHASAEHGQAILEHSLDELWKRMEAVLPYEEKVEPLTIEETDDIWLKILNRKSEWRTLSERNPDLPPED
jgi:creatinine amidohydrolase